MKQSQAKRISMFFTQQQLSQVAEYAAHTGLTQSEIIRRALDQFLEKVSVQNDFRGTSKETRVHP